MVFSSAMSSVHRQALRRARRVVLKVGTRSLVGSIQKPEFHIQDLVDASARLCQEGKEVVVVSSGAIALGCGRLGLQRRPRSMAQLQAAAAAGQSLLMRHYEDAFACHQLGVAQVLLTHADFADRERYLNARGALQALLKAGVVPVVNENDTVSVDEIRFGDNDQLAAMVATSLSADLLVLLTDVDGVLDAHQQRVAFSDDMRRLRALVRPHRSHAEQVSLGGMESKLDAADRAARAGVSVVIATLKTPDAISRIVRGEDVGTLLVDSAPPLNGRKHWIAFTLKPRGAIMIDAGAAKALRTNAKSLLPAGVIAVRGDFDTGDAVQLIGTDGAELGRGLARYGVRDVSRLAGASTDEIATRIGYHAGNEVVHRDDMVVW
jgi:glutamate 5-kinase